MIGRTANATQSIASAKLQVNTGRKGVIASDGEAGRRTAMLSDAVARSSVGAVALCTSSLTTCSRATTLIEASRHTIFWGCNICQYKLLLLLLLQHRHVSHNGMV